MAKLSELVKILCPDGVKFARIGDIATDIYRGSGITRSQVTLTGIPCVRYGEIYTTYGISFEKCISYTDEKLISNKKYFEHGDILFAITGESVEEIAKSSAYIGHEKCLAGGDIVVLKHKQDPKYISYALSTTVAQKQKSKGKVKSKVVHSSVPAISDIKIPLPPLPVQQEIVRILDNFTKLTAELTAELIARKKQYDYYRDILLSVKPNKRDAYKFLGLGDICGMITTGKLDANAMVVGGKYPFYTCDSNPFFINEYAFDTEAILVSGNGSRIGHINYYCGKFNAYQRTYVLSEFKGINVFYLYHYLKAYLRIYIMKNSKKGSIPYITMPILKNFRVPIPSAEQQNHIVAILDRFDTLCNDLTSGLPAEIEARRKQYEYYRDKLLTFKEAK